MKGGEILKNKKILLCILCTVLVMSIAVSAFASSGPSVTTNNIKDILDSVTTQFSVANIVEFLAYIIGATVVFVFLWWGVRRAYRAIVSAATRGKAGLGGGRRG